MRIRLVHGETWGDFPPRRDDDLLMHALACYSFLLNTFELRGKWITLSDFADLMLAHYSHPTTKYLAAHLKAIDKEV